MTTRVTPAGFAAALRGLGGSIPNAVEGGMRESARRLGGELVQSEIATAEPHQPVDQGQYKAGWLVTNVPGGAVVGNSTRQAVWMERGRAPGPVPFAPILAWVKRKGFAKASVKAAAKAKGIRRGANGRFQGASKQDIEDAERSAAFAIARSIALRGIQPRWVLRRAIHGLRSRMKSVIERHLRGIRP